MDILNQFGVQPTLLLAQAVNFFILLFILKKFLYAPILKVLDERKKKIAGSLKDAEEIEKRLVAMEEREQKELLKVEKEVKKILEEAGAASRQIIEEGRAKAVSEAEKIIENTKTSLESEREKLHQEVRAQVAELVTVSLVKVIGKSINKKEQQKLIEDSLKELR